MAAARPYYPDRAGYVHAMLTRSSRPACRACREGIPFDRELHEVDDGATLCSHVCRGA